jgi:hypothetical protein
MKAGIVEKKTRQPLRDECNLSYSEELFISRTVLSFMDRRGLSVSGIEGYNLFTD